MNAKTNSFADAPVVLSVDHVAKSFKLPTEQATGLKQAFINWTKGIKGYKQQQVLRDVSFEVHQGEFFGIVGRNGGGKSTLLKLISGIYVPDKGAITTNGKLVPFIELGVGFNPELTGRENVYLNGALLGFTHEEVEAMYDDIVAFAELGEFMDQKLKNYSSGMQVRLAFSVAIKAQGDILVLDEVLAVGDEAFQRKCDAYFSEVREDPTKTVILVTHDMAAVKKYCNRAILIRDGEIAVSGDSGTVSEQYTLDNLAQEKKDAERERQRLAKKDEKKYPNGLNERCPVLKTIAVSPQVCTSSEPFKFDVEYQFDEDTDFYLAVAVHDIRRGGIPYDTGSKTFRMTKHGHQVAHFELPLDLFNNGEFRLLTSLRTPNPNNDEITDAVAVALDDNACEFVIRDPRNTKNYALLSDRAMRITQLDD
ncbi:sugar ABC transporter [Bifidobacterium myosotis]|uniref:ATP-binding cassette domain-containing protein n=1 Tax=Bifidobacterium myosotis TaxID=1630166 RepID=A0A261FHQ0_9BIFI|nr:polysaccharide ABC transporter ATP-binding protein [Bifidobacterium myosotis]KAA8825472.1 ATP-binding cassette domain-containing protein [Bifidobacterium myosotis]OZG58598.1 sugar ABC transporter [Bifidobacterium myosotis]